MIATHKNKESVAQTTAGRCAVTLEATIVEIANTNRAWRIRPPVVSSRAGQRNALRRTMLCAFGTATKDFADAGNDQARDDEDRYVE